MNRSGATVALLLLALALPSEAFFFGLIKSYEPGWNLCDKCRCPSIVQEAREHGVDCRGANFTTLEPGLTIPSVYPKADFSKNNIGSITETTFNTSTALKSLDLSANNLKVLGKRVFKPLQRLQRLLLSNNILETLDEETFDGLTNLTELDLSYNKLSSLPSNVFDYVPRLRTLSLAFNNLGDPDGSLLTKNLKLVNLDLSGVGLKSISANFFFMNMTKLEKLSLAFNSLEMIPTKALSHLSDSLVYLDLSANPIKSLGAYSFHSLANVKTLILKQMLQMETIDDYAFGDLTSLQKCEITYMPKIRKLESKAFHTSKEESDSVLLLEDFTFSFSILSTLPEELLKWDHLRQVRLEYNHWNCDCEMKWIKNSTLLDMAGDKMVCSQPSKLRGHRLSKVDEKFLVCGVTSLTEHESLPVLISLMVLGIVVSLATVALLVYWRQGWLCRRPDNPYSRVTAGRTTITVTDEMEWDNKDLETDSQA